MSEDTAGLTVAGQMDRLAGILQDNGMAVTRRVIPSAPTGGSTNIGWLWVRREPPLFPHDDYDVLVTYEQPGDGWSATRLDGHHEVIGSHQLSLQAVALQVTGFFERPVERESGHSGRDASIVSAALGAVAATVVLPFIQVIVSKSAEDAYTRLRSIFTKGADQPTTGRPRQLALIDEDSGATLIAPDPLPADALRQLLAIPAADLRSRVHIWDEVDRSWHSYERQEPPHAK